MMPENLEENVKKRICLICTRWYYDRYLVHEINQVIALRIYVNLLSFYFIEKQDSRILSKFSCAASTSQARLTITYL